MPHISALLISYAPKELLEKLNHLFEFVISGGGGGDDDNMDASELLLLPISLRG